MKKEGEIMTRVFNTINEVNIPSHIREEIGVSENWINNVSPKQKRLVFRITNRFKEALKKLSKS